MRRRVLLTGATGVIGEWIVRQWPSDGPDLLIPVGRADEDLLEPGAPERLLARERPTDLVHLAWSASGVHGYRTSPTNAAWYSASLAFVAAARSNGIRCWLTGTVVDNADMRPGGSTDEYTLHKARLRRTLDSAIHAGEIGWFRPTYVIDDQKRRPSLVADALEAAERGRPVVLRTPHDQHDFVHAADVGSAMMLAVRSQVFGFLPVGSGRSRPVRDLVEALGARWVVGQARGDQRHSGEAAEVGWLTARGWAPVNTNDLFGMMGGAGG